MKRVVITGWGAVTPIGNSIGEFSQSLRAGTSGIGRITHIDPQRHTTTYAAEVKNIEQHSQYNSRELRRMDPYSVFAHLASKEALSISGLTESSFDPTRVGVIFGVGIGGFKTIEDIYIKHLDSEHDSDHISIPPLSIPKLIINIGAGNVALHHQLRGPCYTVATACASGNDAIGQSYTLIRSGSVDAVITGGVEAPITHVGISGFNALHALSTKFSEDPSKASRPFDKDRDGFVIGEAAGVLVLESEEHAKARNAPILGEIAGYAATCDAYHQTAPHPEGIGAQDAMKLALQDANLALTDIDYINAHGTSTPINDPTETHAIREVFGPHADALKVSSTKSMTGHCIGAAGALEAIASLVAIREGFIPPTINLDTPDERCDLDYVPHKAEEKSINVAMSNTFGFGGHNGVLIIKRYT